MLSVKANQMKHMLKGHHSNGAVAKDAITTMLPYNNTRPLATRRCNRSKRNTTTLT